ncbi:MAG TPA: 3-dehydroquinate synthase [Beutenbergiaceae bacterium]|nr:3-dehydroquinate synthase [Beutenbergiaceae bacterium]
MSTIWVRAEHRYPVVVQPGAHASVTEHLPAGATQVLLVHPQALAATAATLAERIRGAGRQVHSFQMPDGEAAKDLKVISQAWDRLGEQAFTRSDAIVALGGGAVTDSAGFVGATWLRGVPVLHIPTTLLGMVDAAVGGKTGINTAAGKNLVGAFHSPVAVLCDVELLATLPVADLRAGLAEVIKCGFIADTQILSLVQDHPDAVLDPTSPILTELIRRAITVKAEVVSADLREADRREVLNYGHTLAHAIENAESYRWRHGDAVAVGMVFAAELAFRTGHLDRAGLDRHREVLQAAGLPTSYHGGRWERLVNAMRRDKKSRAGVLRFVVLDRIGSPTRLEGPDEQVLRACYEAISAKP